MKLIFQNDFEIFFGIVRHQQSFLEIKKRIDHNLDNMISLNNNYLFYREKETLFSGIFTQMHYMYVHKTK